MGKTNSRIGPELMAKVKADWPDICAAVAAGAQAGAEFERHGYSRWHVAAFLAQDVEAKAQWDRSREASADAFADQAQDIANNPGADSRSARVRLQALQWLASKRNPRVYSEKAQLDVNVRTVDLTKVIQDAQARLAASRTAQVVEGQVIRQALEATR